MPMFPWFNHIFGFQHVIYRRQRGKELTGIMTVDKDMAYGFTDKLRCPGSGFNSIAFMLKRLVPGGPRPNRLRVCPPAEFPGSNIKYPAGPFRDDGVRSILLTYGIQCKSPIEKGGVSS